MYISKSDLSLFSIVKFLELVGFCKRQRVIGEYLQNALYVVRAANSKLLGTKILELPKPFRVQT